MHTPLRTLVNSAVIGMLSATVAHAGGFSLYMEDSGYAVGIFGAGLAAEAADASIGWYNPAGLVLIPSQELVVGGVGVFPVSRLTGTSTFHTVTDFAPPFPASIDYVQDFSGIRSAENAGVPSLHYALPLGENLTFGLSLVSPFGLATDWGVLSPIRYEATRTSLKTVNLSPQLGVRLSPNFSLGVGVDLQYARVKFNRILGAPTALILMNEDPTELDSLSYNKGNSFGVGFHAGVMGMFDENHSRVGLNYQSKMNHTFYGKSTLTGFLASAPFLDNPFAQFVSNELVSNPVKLPDIVTLSGYRDVNDRLAVLGSVVYTGWSVFKEIQLNNVAAVSPNLENALVNSNSPQYYHDAWRVAVGANYYLNSLWMLRVGGGYDETPTDNFFRDARLPDTSRWGLSVGSHYQMRPNVGFDVGYTHLFAIERSQINRTDPIGLTSTYNVRATGNNKADIVSAQVVWLIDQPEEAPSK